MVDTRNNSLSDEQSRSVDAGKRVLDFEYWRDWMSVPSNTDSNLFGMTAIRFRRTEHHVERGLPWGS